MVVGARLTKHGNQWVATFNFIAASVFAVYQVLTDNFIQR